MRPVPLTAIKGGISRLRVKGGARADTMYDLVNAYVTDAGTVVPRPGTFRNAILPSTTRGLVAFQGKRHVFSHQVEPVLPGGYVSHVLSNPNDPSSHIHKIHFSVPFMGFLYVVAEFEDGTVAHFWLYVGPVWQASTPYLVGDTIAPTVANGLSYRAMRLTAPGPVWAPSVLRAINDVVEPTTYNGFSYTVTAVEGPSPSSGPLEPTWPTNDLGVVVEYSNITVPTTTGTGLGGSGDSKPTIPTDIQDRYGAQ